MATPTEQVARSAEAFLGDQHDVVLALRVEWGPDAIESRKQLRRGLWTEVYLWSTLVVRPFLSLLRLKDTLKADRDPNTGSGILALTADDGRILLATSPLRSKVPTGVIEELPAGAPLYVDVELMENHLIPTLTVADREFVINGIDFRALLKAVEGLRVRSPEIKAILARLQGVGKAVYGRRIPSLD